MDRAEKEAHAKDEKALKEDDHRKREDGPMRKIAEDDQNRKDKNEGDEKMQKAREHNREGKNLSGKIDRFDQITAVGKRAKGQGEACREVTPGKISAHEKHRKIFHPDLDDVIESQGIDNDDEKGV